MAVKQQFLQQHSGVFILVGMASFHVRKRWLVAHLQAESKDLACPSVTQFMQYVLMRLNVTFINLDEPKVRSRTSSAHQAVQREPNRGAPLAGLHLMYRG